MTFIFYNRLTVLLLIRRGLTRLNQQLLRLLKMLPEWDEWEGESVGSCKEKKEKKYRERHENGDCRESLYSGSDIP